MLLGAVGSCKATSRFEMNCLIEAFAKAGRPAEVGAKNSTIHRCFPIWIRTAKHGIFIWYSWTFYILQCRINFQPRQAPQSPIPLQSVLTAFGRGYCGYCLTAVRVLFRLCLKWDVLPNTISSTEWHTKAGGRSANMPHMHSATIRVATSICEDRIG